MKLLNQISIPLAILIILSGCNESSEAPGSTNQYEKIDTIAKDQNVVQDSADTSRNTTEPFLDITFIELLEAGMQDEKLKKEGFVKTSSQTTEFGNKFEFQNQLFHDHLKISNSKFPEGAHHFIVEYSVSPDQIKAFEKSLEGSDYKKKTDQPKYKKNGTGTYIDKIIELDTNKNIIIYRHLMGKEVSPNLPEHELLDSN